MARKVFISFLGFNNYAPCHYCCSGYKSAEVRYVQEATLDYLTQKEQWGEDSVALILLTEGAEKKNWVDNGHRDRDTGEIIRQDGLYSQLTKMMLPFPVVPIKGLPDGNNEEEIWTIFKRVFDEIDEGDELYFDLTHGFRYLPMLVLVLGNYAKFLKNVTIKHISYGNYEGRDKNTNEALLVDLLPLSGLQDWTFAAASFLDSGNVRNLSILAENTYRPMLANSRGQDVSARALRQFSESLKTWVEDMQTCRGISIINGKNVASLKEAISASYDNLNVPLRPVVQKVESAVETFDDKYNVQNGFAAARWCLDNGLYQQAATILQENVTSYIAIRHGIEIDNEEDRGLVNSAITIIFNDICEEKWNVVEGKEALLKDIMTDTVLANRNVVNAFNSLSEVRNDLNHSGMRSKRIPLKPDKIKTNISKCLDIIQQELK